VQGRYSKTEYTREVQGRYSKTGYTREVQGRYSKTGYTREVQGRYSKTGYTREVHAVMGSAFITHTYEYMLKFGNRSLEARLTPGHTAGTVPNTSVYPNSTEELREKKDLSEK
jgi:hypothetical protein